MHGAWWLNETVRTLFCLLIKYEEIKEWIAEDRSLLRNIIYKSLASKYLIKSVNEYPKYP